MKDDVVIGLQHDGGVHRQRGQSAGKYVVVVDAVDGLKWIDRNTAEVHGGVSNGMDGRLSRYRVVRKRDNWVVESVVLEAQS